MPVDGETVRVHAAGGNSGGGTWTEDTTRDSNRRCGGGQTGDNCAMHADIIPTRCTQRRASINAARRVCGGSLAGRGCLRQLEVQSSLCGQKRCPARTDGLELGLQFVGGGASRMVLLSDGTIVSTGGFLRAQQVGLRVHHGRGRQRPDVCVHTRDSGVVHGQFLGDRGIGLKRGLRRGRIDNLRLSGESRQQVRQLLRGQVISSNTEGVFAAQTCKRAGCRQRPPKTRRRQRMGQTRGRESWNEKRQGTGNRARVGG